MKEQAPPVIGAIVNPRAGGWKRLRHEMRGLSIPDTVCRWLAPECPENVRVFEMHGPDDGARLACNAIAEGCTTIVVVGGDGTINDALQGVCSAPQETRPTFGIVPMGTANVLGRILGLPLRDPEQAGRIIQAGTPRTIDLGSANGRWFGLMAGIGFDARVTQSVNRAVKRRLGRAAYLLAAAQVARTYPRHPITVTLDDGTPQNWDAYLVLVANGGCYAGRFRLGPGVKLDDGLLDVFICLRRKSLHRSLAAHSLALIRNRLYASPGVRYFQAHSVVLEAGNGVPVQLDGDSRSSTPTRIEVVPGALRMLMP